MVVKIGLFCAGGMSTSMLEKKMSEAGSKEMIGCTKHIPGQSLQTYSMKESI